MTWDRALAQTLQEFLGKPLEWGRYDCCQFVAAYAKALTGIDHASKFQYDSEASAAELSRDIESLISSCIGPSKSDAVPGDVVVCHVENWKTAGVMVEPYVWAFIHEKGLCRLPLRSIVCAWSL